MYFNIILLATILSITTSLDYRTNRRSHLINANNGLKIPNQINPVVFNPRQQKLRKNNKKEIKDVEKEVEIEQNNDAKYEFQTEIKDDINDLENFRYEIRDGLRLMGQYGYKDGFIKKTVFYEADENGYRVTKEIEESLLDGPKINLNGVASVSTKGFGPSLSYKVQSVRKDDDYIIEQIE